MRRGARSSLSVFSAALLAAAAVFGQPAPAPAREPALKPAPQAAPQPALKPAPGPARKPAPQPALAQAQPQGRGEPRLALVIGNGAYRDQPLKNPVNDARATAASLRKLGFTVIERIDAGKTAMESAILEFGEKLRAGGVGLFYYAGHGIQSGGRNYLLPVDVTVTTEASVRVYGVEAGVVMDLMSDARNRANVVILDACRNNPFVMASRGVGKGLAAIDAARGTLIAYSTAPGMVAVDGDGANSPYTAGLLKALDEPGLKAEEVFKRVRVHVADATKGQQTPWESSSLTGDLILNLSITINPPAAPAAAAGGRDPADVAFWNSISASNDPRDFRDYLKQFPNGVFSGLAARRLSEIERKQLAAEEAEKKRLAALEAERKRQAAEETARQKQVAETERRRIAAEEAEKKRLAAEEVARQKAAAKAAEQQRKAAEEGKRMYEAAERNTKGPAISQKTTSQQQAALPPPAAPAAAPPVKPLDRNELQQKAYNKIMELALAGTTTSATGTGASYIGKPNRYKSLGQGKALAVCIHWNSDSVDRLRIGGWSHNHNDERPLMAAVRKGALDGCITNEAKGCKCHIVDENDKNVLQAPEEFYQRIAAAPQGRTQQQTTPASQTASAIPSAATQQAALPPQAADPKAKWDGKWKVWLKRRREDYNGEATIKDGRVKLRARADIYMMIGDGEIDDQGGLAMILKFENRPDSYPLKLKFQGGEATGTWDSGYEAKFTKQ